MDDGFEQRLPRGVAVSRRVEAPPWRAAIGARDHASAHVIVRGSFYLARGEHRALPLDPGDLVLVGAGDPGTAKLYCVAPPSGEAELVSADYAPAKVPGLAEGEVVHVRAGERSHAARGLAAIVGLLAAAVADPSADQVRIARSLLEPLLAYALEGREGAGTPSDERIARALRLLRASPAERWSVEALARAASLSRAAFARRFLAETGVPPLRYLAELRMEIAARLLAEGDDSLASIAARVGYESEFAFSRAFKRHTGEAPGVYRRRLRSGQASLRLPPTRAAA